MKMRSLLLVRLRRELAADQRQVEVAPGVGHLVDIGAGEGFFLSFPSQPAGIAPVQLTFTGDVITNGVVLPPGGQFGMFGSPADYADFLKSELPKWIAMAKLSGASAE